MDDQELGFLGSALAELADVVPEDATRVGSVHARIRRRRNGRRASRAAVGVVAAAAVVAGLIALQRPPTDVTVVPASAATSSTVPERCAREGGVPGVVKTVPPEASAAAAAVAAKAAAIAKEATASAAGAAPSDDTTGRQQGIKGYGSIVAVSADSITIQIESPPDQPAQIQAAITGDTTFVDNGATLTRRPALAAGDHVAFGAVSTGSGYDLGILETNPTPPPPPGQEADGGAKVSGDGSAAGSCVTAGS